MSEHADKTTALVQRQAEGYCKTICTFDLVDYLDGETFDTIEVQCLHSNGSLNRVIEIPIDSLPFITGGPNCYPFFKVILRGQRSQANEEDLP
jgi:hypothetical protein